MEQHKQQTATSPARVAGKQPPPLDSPEQDVRADSPLLFPYVGLVDHDRVVLDEEVEVHREPRFALEQRCFPRHTPVHLLRHAPPPEVGDKFNDIFTSYFSST